MPEPSDTEGAAPPAGDAERLAEACRQRDALLRALVHDLRNPLNGVLTWIHLLRSGRLDEPSTRHALASIERESEQQALLLADLADYAELLGDAVRFRSERVEPQAIVLAAAEALRPRAEQASVRLETVLGATGAVACDPDWTGRAVRCLLAHALEPANEARQVTVAMSAKRTGVEIRVVDDGRGFAAGERAKLFEPVPTDGRSVGGRLLRLQLAIADRIARLGGAELDAESAGPGAGTTLKLQLPHAGEPTGGDAPG